MQSGGTALYGNPIIAPMEATISAGVEPSLSRSRAGRRTPGAAMRDWGTVEVV